MAIQLGVLVFTGERKFEGKQYLGRLNMDRTVSRTLLLQLRLHESVTAEEICASINVDIERIQHAAKYPGVETIHPRTLAEVKRHIASVIRRSQQGGAKHIPRGIHRDPSTNALKIGKET